MRKSTVLIIDDEAFILDELREAFEDEDYIVLTALNGDEARAIAEVNRIDLLITDLKMPRLDGIALYRQLKELAGFSAPAILLSGHGAHSNKVDALEAGFAQCLAKPVDLDALLHSAGEICARPMGS